MYDTNTMLQSMVNEKVFASTVTELLKQAKIGLDEIPRVQGVQTVLLHLESNGARILSADQIGMVSSMASEVEQLRAEVRRLSLIAPPPSLATAGPTVDPDTGLITGHAIDCTDVEQDSADAAAEAAAADYAADAAQET